MRDQVDFAQRRSVNLVQHLPSAIGHHHQPRGEGDQLFDGAPLVGLGFAQNGMQRGDDRHFQLAQHGQDVTADRAAEYAELMLQAHDVDIADVQKICSSQVRRQILLFDFEANYFRIVIPILDIVDGNAQALALGIGILYSRQQISGECGDAALRGRWSPTKAILRIFAISFKKTPFSAMLQDLFCHSNVSVR